MSDAESSSRRRSLLKISERYAREWLAQNAASGYLSYDPASRRFELPPEQAMVLANDESPFFMGGGFDAVAALHQTQFLVRSRWLGIGDLSTEPEGSAFISSTVAQRRVDRRCS